MSHLLSVIPQILMLFSILCNNESTSTKSFIIADAPITVNPIDSTAYYTLKKQVNPKKEKFKEIKDFKKAKKLLKNIVYFGGYTDNYELDENIDDQLIVRIKYRNGKDFYYKNGDIFTEAYFIAYYPEEDILLCEGGHTTDVSFNLSTGEETESTGNPETIVTSPNRQYRLNGSYGGQECYSYFFQKKTENGYRKIIQLDEEFEKITQRWLCYIQDAFWTQDNTLYINLAGYNESGITSHFYKIKINEKWNH